MQQGLPHRPIEGFEQTQEDHLTSKERDRPRQTSLYFKIPQAKPLLSKQFIDHGKPKVLIKEVKINKQTAELINALVPHHLSNNEKPMLGRREEPKLAETTLWKRYILSNNYKCVYVKYLNTHPEDFQGKNQRRMKIQIMKMTLNREYLFGTYIMDINFLSDGAVTFLRNLQETSLKQDEEYLHIMNSNYEFDSRFQCGNLMYVFQRNQLENIHQSTKEFYLILQNDINTKGYGNWFYFKFLSKQPGRYRFTITNIQKNYSFFGFGMRPIFFSLRKYNNDRIGWHYEGQNIVYQRNQLLKDESGKSRYNTLSFTYEQTQQNDVVYLAAGLPYSYSKLITYIDSLERIAKNHSNLYFRKEGLTSTVSSNECPLLTITWKRDRRKEEAKNKKKIVLVIARQHPSEVVSSFVLQGFINYLVQLQGGESTIELLKKYIFKVVPMANIDGVIYGNSRCDITGSDANRKWTKNPNHPLYPVISSIKKMVSNLVFEGYEIEYFIDLHGHSRKLGSFIYSCKNYDEVETRMFSWIMSRINEKFSYENCRFGISNFRRETARGYMMGIATNRKSMTLQTSFFGYKGSNGLKQFQIADLHGMGGSLAQAIHIDTFRNSKSINWNTLRADIKATVHNRTTSQEQEESSGSDSNPQVDELTVKEKVETFLTPAAAAKLGLIDIKIVEKARKEEGREDNHTHQHDFYSNHQIFNQNYDTILNQKYLQSQILTKTQKINGLRQSKSVTKTQPFRFNSQQKKKPLSLTKRIKIAIDIQRIQKKQQRLGTPSLPLVMQKPNGRQFWSNLKKQYQSLVNQKKLLMKTDELKNWPRPC